MRKSEYFSEICKIWGHLYVYHPSVVRGDLSLNFESSLVRVLDQCPEIKNDHEFLETINSLLMNLQDAMASIYKVKPTIKPEILDYNGLLIKRTHLGFSEEATYGPYRKYWSITYLEKFGIEPVVIQIDSNYYLTYNNFIYLDINNSEKLSKVLKTNLQIHLPKNIEDLSIGEKLLGLFKTWNTFKYFFPHYQKTKSNWETALVPSIDRILSSSTNEEYIHVIEELTALSEDAHVRLIIDENNSKYAPRYAHTFPVEIEKIENQAVVVRSEDSRFKIGDIILEINGKSIEKLENELRPRLSCSTKSSLNWHIYVNLCGELSGREGEKVTLKKLITNGAEEIELRYSLMSEYWRINIPGKVSDIFNNNGKKIGYINLGIPKTKEEFELELEKVFDTDALILDLRCYPKFWTSVSILPRISNKTFISGNFKIPVIDEPYEVEYSQYKLINRGTESIENQVVTPSVKPIYNKKIAVLVDYKTKSSPEDFCIYLKNATRATFIGSETAGSNGNVTSFKIPGDIKVKFSGMNVTYLDDSPFQRIGVPIDIEVTRTIKGIKEGRDEVIERALDHLANL